MFENEECVAECRIQNVHLFGCYWISSEILTLALLSLHGQVYPTYPILSPLTINYALASHPAFNLDPYVHSRIIHYSATRTYENELYKTAIFIGQKESNSKFT